jgi:hypothetical protein
MTSTRKQPSIRVLGAARVVLGEESYVGHPCHRDVEAPVSGRLTNVKQSMMRLELHWDKNGIFANTRKVFGGLSDVRGWPRLCEGSKLDGTLYSVKTHVIRKTSCFL